jgi:hypothetical protein
MPQDKPAATAGSDGLANGSAAATAEAFDPRKLALGQDFASMVGVRRETLRVPISRPPNQAFFMTHPDPAWRIQVAAIEVKETKEVYIVAPSMTDELNGEWVPKILVPCVTRQGGVYLWPIRLPGEDGKLDSWNESAMRIASEYAGKWVRVVPNRELGAYDVVTPISVFPSPEWPESADDLLKKAFRDRVIECAKHPVIRQLRGMA